MTAAKIALLESDIRKLMDREKVPGSAIVLIENGEVISHTEYGVKNINSPLKIDSKTVFEAASLSKPVFAYAALQLVENGKLDLDAPLIEYLPYADVVNDKKISLITARMVLAHTTGFPNWRPNGEALQIHFSPGAKFSYSGEGFFYLQKVLEHVTGITLEDYLQKIVLKPLKMTCSSFVWQPEYEKLKASGHIDGLALATSRPLQANAAFTLHTTALDYAQFILALMHDTGLQPKTINQMLTPQVSVDAGAVHCIHKSSGISSETISWGLGIGLETLPQGNAFWHWGDNAGFKSYVVGFKKEKKALIIFTNSSNGLGLSIIPELIYKIWGVRQAAFDWIDSEKTPF